MGQGRLLRDPPQALRTRGRASDEPCAQLGPTPDFERVNRHELRAFQAAVIAVNGAPPAPLEFAAIANAHDFGTYRTLWIISLVAVLPPGARRWLDRLDVPSSWISAGFPPPVTYAGSSFPCVRPFADVIAAALQITRPREDGRFFPPENAVLHRNLEAAYGPMLAASEAGVTPAMPTGG
jgi:hypothetical protein